MRLLSAHQQCLALNSTFALVRGGASIRVLFRFVAGSQFTSALSWQLDELVLALLPRRVAFTPGYACNCASWLRPASPRTPGPNTLGFAAAACSAPPARPLSGAGVAPVGAGVPFRSRVSNVCGFDISHLDVRDHTCLFKAAKVVGAAEEGKLSFPLLTLRLISPGPLRARWAASNFQEVFGGTLLGGSAFFTW
jgi:hypothetical protein